MAKTNGNAKKQMTKSEIMESLATEASLTKKEVARILEGLTKLIEKNIGKRGPGVFNVTGSVEGHGGSQASDRSPQRDQPLHGSGDDV